MIRFIELLTSFFTEVLLARNDPDSSRSDVIKHTLLYALIALSFVSNYFLIKKVYSVTKTAYHYKQQVKTYQELPEQLRMCQVERDILSSIVYSSMDPGMIKNKLDSAFNSSTLEREH